MLCACCAKEIKRKKSHRLSVVLAVVNIAAAVCVMDTIFETLPELLLAIMGLLGLVRARRCRDAFAATAALFGVEEPELYREVELFLQDRWQEELAVLDVHLRGLPYFVGEAAERRPHPLLLEAACRLKGAQLTIWNLERHSAELYGRCGPMYTAAIVGGEFIALSGEPLMPWYSTVARELEPGTSHEGEGAPMVVLPMLTGPGETVREAEACPRHEEISAPQMERSGEDAERNAANEELAASEHSEDRGQPIEAVPSDDGIERARWQEALAVRYREMLRPRFGANAPAEREPRRRATRVQPDFTPADISVLPAHMAAELVAPTTPPYIVRNNKILCRLAHCGAHDREFETVGAWKKHVALARSHLQDAFCGTCGHYLIVPPEISPENIKTFIAAHKKERCVGASKATVRARRAHVAWLENLRRRTCHILVPDMHQAEETMETETQPLVVGRKRHYDTEEARRADVCVAYLKRFKMDEPELLAEIANEHELQLP